MIPQAQRKTPTPCRGVDPALKQLEAAAATLGVALPAPAVDSLRRYAGELLLWRTRLNLTGAATLSALVDPHLLDVLLLIAAVNIPEGAAIVDIGTGGGLPGIPLKLIRRDVRVVLVEASRRKVAFLEHLQTALGLDDVRIEWGRAEDLAHRRDLRETFDIGTTQATAHLAAAAELCLPFVRVQGVGVCLKGRGVLRELDGAAPLIEALGARIESYEQIPLPTTEVIRTIVILRKRHTMPEGYPRSAHALGNPPRLHKGTEGSAAE